MRKKITAAEIVTRLQGRAIELVEYAGSVTGRSTFLCLVDGCGHKWKGTADNITRGRGCPRCSGNVPVDMAELLNRLKGRGITVVHYAGQANDSSSVFRCDIDGYEWTTSATSVMGGTGCSECMYKASRVSDDEARQRIADRNMELVEYGGASYKKSKFKCLVDGCGHEWETTLRIIIDEGTGCKKCAGLLKLTPEVARQRLEGRPIELIEYAGTTAGMSKFRCAADGCGHEWETTFSSVYSNKQGCQKCAGNGQLTLEEALRRIEGKSVEMLEYSGQSATPSKFRCTVDGCGHEWEAPVRAIVGSVSNGCRKCAGSLKLTYDDLISRIGDRPISVLSYGGSTAASSAFKCTVDGCEHEWTTSASNIINSGCGCPKCALNAPVTREEVVNRLNGRPIALVDYAGSVDGATTFKCLNENCGHEWVATVDRVTNSGRGCPACAEYGFNPKKDAYFYAYKITRSGVDYLGFGITVSMDSRDYAHQHSFNKAGATGELLFSYKTTGKVAQEFERVIKKNFPIVDTGIPGFRTEAFEYDDELLDLIKIGAEHAHRKYLETMT